MTEDIRVPLTPHDFLARVDESWLRLMGFVESLTPAQITGPTDAAGWTVKDHLAHLASWEGGMVALLQKQPRYEGMGVTKDLYMGYDIDQLNEGIRQQTTELSLEAVLDNFQETHRNLVGLIESTPEADLQQSYAWFQPDEADIDDGKPIYHRIAGNTFAHYDEHMPWMTEIIGA